MTDYFDAKMIATVLGGEVTGPNQVRAPGPGHSKNDRSLSVKIEPSARDGFLVHSFANDDYWICRNHVLVALGVLGRAGALASSIENSTQNGSSSYAALRLWNEAVDARDTLVDVYLQSRGLTLPDPTCSAIRFHPKCPFGPSVRHPCMVTLFRDIRTNEPKALLRTALEPDGKKIGRKMLGPKGGCAAKLSGDADISQGLTIGEGIETTIAGIAEGFGPAWAVGDAGEMARFPVLPGIESLAILVDNDESGTGAASALECSKRWTAAGLRVQRVIPEQMGTDMADVVAATGAAP